MRRLLVTLLTAMLLAGLQLAPGARAFEVKPPCPGGSPSRAAAILEAQPRLDAGSGGHTPPEKDEYPPLPMARPEEVRIPHEDEDEEDLL